MMKTPRHTFLASSAMALGLSLTFGLQPLYGQAVTASKIFISVDMEGIAGAVRGEALKNPGRFAPYTMEAPYTMVLRVRTEREPWPGAMSSVMTSLLFGVSATDPGTYVSVALALLTVSLVACWIPAVRAAGVNPSVALRAD